MGEVRESEEELKLGHVNLFWIEAHKSQVKPVEGEELQWLKDLSYKLDYVKAAYAPGEEIKYKEAEIKRYLSEKGAHPTEENIKYARDVIFKYFAMSLFRDYDELYMDSSYLKEMPFIRLKLRELGTQLGESKLRFYPYVIVHRLGVVVITLFAEIPPGYTVNELNKLIEQISDELKNPYSPLSRDLFSISTDLITILLLLRKGYGDEDILRIINTIHKKDRGEAENIESENPQLTEEAENIVKEVKKAYETSISIPVVNINIQGFDNTEDLLKKCPRQLAALASGMGDWRLLSSRLAEDNLKKCLVADYRDFLYLAGATGVYIELGVPSILIEGVEIRNEEAEKHIALLEKGLEVAYAYQFMASAEAVLDSYNKRLRRLDPNEADLREIEALRDVVERGLEELDNYTLVLADPLRSMLHKGSSNRGLFLLERIVRRRVSYLHSVIWRRKRDAQETLLTLLSIILGSGLLSIMGAWSPLLTMILPIFPLLTMILLILMFFAIAAAILIGGPAIVYTIRDAIRRLRK